MKGKELIENKHSITYYLKTEFNPSNNEIV